MARHELFVKDEEKLLIGYEEVGRLLGVSRRTLMRMVQEGRFPQPLDALKPRVKWARETVRETVQKWKEGK